MFSVNVKLVQHKKIVLFYFFIKIFDSKQLNGGKPLYNIKFSHTPLPWGNDRAVEPRFFVVVPTLFSWASVQKIQNVGIGVVHF